MNEMRRMLLAAALLPGFAGAEDKAERWPSRPVKIVVGFPPGQGSDVIARIYAENLQNAFASPFIIENRPGAGGLLAASAVAKSPPDGHTLLFTSSGPFTISPHLYGERDFDPMGDFEPIALLGRSPTLLLVRPDSPVTTVPELIEMSMKTELHCGSSGYGITDHLTMELLKLVSGARFNHVPYKGSIAALSDLVGDRIHVVFASSTSAMSFVKPGRVRVLAVASGDRWAAMPDVPAISESYPGFEATSWAMMAAPRGTPDPIKNRLADRLNAAMNSRAVVDALSVSGLDATPGTSPEESKAYAMSEFAKWGDVIAKAGIKLP